MHTHSLVCFKDLINDCDCVSGEKRLASLIYRYWVMCLFCKVPMWDQSDVEVGKCRKKAKTIRDIFKSLKKGLEYWKHMSLYARTGKEYSSREDDSDSDRGGLTLPLSIPVITPVSQASTSNAGNRRTGWACLQWSGIVEGPRQHCRATVCWKKKKLRSTQEVGLEQMMSHAVVKPGW